MTLRLTALAVAFLFGNSGAAGDWPQWRGAKRDGRSAETGLIAAFPGGPPKLLWTCETAGKGYGGPAIAGTTLYALGAEDDNDNEFVFALDTTTGKEKWKTPIPILQKDRSFNTNWGGGPRSTPTVDGKHLYVIGANGDLACLETATGKIVWHKSMIKDLGGKVMMIWGYSESPLVDGDLLICCPGYESKSGHGGIQALDKLTGEVKWVCDKLTDTASYASPVISHGGGVKQYVLMTDKGVAGVRAADGKLLWKSKLGANGIAVIPTPVVSGDLVYVTSDYKSGCGTLELTKSADGVDAKELFSNHVMENHHGGVVLHDNAIFGFHGNANAKKPLPLVCQDIRTGKTLWQKEQTLEGSSIIYADGHFWCYGQKTGTMVTVKADTKGFTEAGRFTIPKASKLTKPQGGIWTHPVIAHGRLYLRDQELLFCFDIAGGPEAE